MTGVRGPAATGLGKQLKSEQARVVVPFEDNRHLNRLLGEYDGHLALLEERLGIEAHAHGNVVTLTGPAGACETAREVLEKLYARIRQGEDIGPGDFDGLLRHAADDAPPRRAACPDRARAAGSSRRARPRRAPTCRPWRRSISCSASAPPAPARPISPSPMPRNAWSAGEVERIILSRPAVEAGERLGFLPGDMREKVDPYLRPLYDALYDVLPPAKVERDLETGVIEIAPLAFMRGRTLAHAFVILDEAQNTTSMQMKMFLTRIGEGSKMAVTGDPSQIDLPHGQRSGLEEAVGAAGRRRGHRGDPLHLRRRRAPRSRRAHRRRLRQGEVGRIARMSAPGDSTSCILDVRARPEPEPPERLRISIVQEQADWSGFDRPEQAI